MIKLTELQSQALHKVNDQNGEKYKFTQDERKIALALERKGLIIRIDATGNYYDMTGEGHESLPEKTPILLFTYGTLMRNCGNHHIIKGAKFISEATVKGFKMYSMGSFPFCMQAEETDIVKGEVFEIDEDLFRGCDRLEGYPRFYNRVNVTTEEGHEVWIYFIDSSSRDNEHYPAGYPLVESGDWIEFKENKKNNVHEMGSSYPDDEEDCDNDWEGDE